MKNYIVNIRHYSPICTADSHIYSLLYIVRNKYVEILCSFVQARNNTANFLSYVGDLFSFTQTFLKTLMNANIY